MMIDKTIFSQVLVVASVLNFKVLAAVLGGMFFNIGFLILIFLVFSKKFKKYHIAVNHLSTAHASVRELDFQNHQSGDTVDEPELLFYKASHDLKGPLKTIRGLAQLANKDSDRANQKIYMEKINETATGLEDFLEEILSLGRIKKQRAKRTAIDIKRFLTAMIQTFENYPGRDKLEINLVADQGIYVYSDESLLKSVFQNLVENAVKYRDDRKPFSELRIAVVASGNCLEVTFSDNGLGIASENLPYVFDLFYRVDSLKEGSGLGLYIVQEAMKKLSGKIKVASRFNFGSEFTIELPFGEEKISSRKEGLAVSKK